MGLSGDPFDIYYFIYEQSTERLFKYSANPVMKNLDHMDPNGILDFTISFIHHKESPYKRSEQLIRREPDELGI
jgi:hypothetical protein